MKKISTIILSSFCLLAGCLLSAQGTNTPASKDTILSENEIDWCNSYEEALGKSQKQGKPILILFTGTSWCPACMKLEKEVLGKPEFAKGVGNNFIFYKAEFSEPSPEGLAKSPDSVLLDKYNVDKFPTFVAIDGNSRQQLFSLNYKPEAPAAYVKELNLKLKNAQPYTKK